MGLFDYQQYTIVRTGSWHKFMIKDTAGNDLGRIQGNQFSIATQYTVYDSTGAKLGIIKNKNIAIQPSYSIIDPDGVTIATLKGLQTMIHGSKYWFENAQGDEIMRAKGKDSPSGGQNFRDDNYRILDPAGSVVAEISNVAFGTLSVIFLSPNTNRYLVLAAAVCIHHCEHPEKTLQNNA